MKPEYIHFHICTDNSLPLCAFLGSCCLLHSPQLLGILDSQSLQHWADLLATLNNSLVSTPSTASGFPPHLCDTCCLLSLLELSSLSSDFGGLYTASCSSSSFCDCGLISHVLLLGLVPILHAVPNAVQLDITGAHGMPASKSKVFAVQYLLFWEVCYLCTDQSQLGGQRGSPLSSATQWPQGQARQLHFPSVNGDLCGSHPMRRL